MKKLLLLLLIAFGFNFSYAQIIKTQTKKTSNLPQKVHNVFHKDKEYNGSKTKGMKNGHLHVTKRRAKGNKTKVY